MNFDRLPSPERSETGREKLLRLEKEGKFVFHGSDALLNALEPRQAQKFDEAKGVNIGDGEPALFASKFADMAIFRALISEKLINEESNNGFGTTEDNSPQFYATRNLIEAAKNRIGKVYVLNGESFKPTVIGGSEYRSTEIVKPVEVVEVTFKDLPTNIKIIE